MACVLRRAGHDVVLWAREPEVVRAIDREAANPVFLPGITIPAGIVASNDLAAAAAGADFLLLAPPAQHMRSVTLALAPHLVPGTPVVSCSKGIERGSCALMSEVIDETLPTARLAVMSGPSFAHEIAAGLPAGVTLACTDLALAARLAQAIGSPRFRTYLSDDIVGAQLGGALKNVYGIACGIVLGRKLGSSARSTLVARSLDEMMRLGLAMGARQETFTGLSGVGDLDLCANSPSSRNMSLGIALGEGRQLQDVLAERVTVQEGVHSAESVAALARSHALDMPIALAVDRILNHDADIDAAIEQLLARPCGLERVSAAP
ncbi:MAG: NAD(P)-dependent glycerol-3-phosphate dehydrogenase [Rhodocyclales bacterium]|nr:NAD(P)-dependent glycerol-3-phosphate dehydrogenase [Rhodocyclales bacterium]